MLVLNQTVRIIGRFVIFYLFFFFFFFFFFFLMEVKVGDHLNRSGCAIYWSVICDSWIFCQFRLTETPL